jgi:2,4-dienoyl-CoA reductase-like NADH-dependent reductase (Old Yellow Enzyme family)
MNMQKDLITLFTPAKLKNKIVKNRVVFPPVVCFHYAGEDGIVAQRNIEHYRLRAEGGAGIIITEATAVRKDGRLAPFQLGIWSDDHIPGMQKIVSVVKLSGAVSLLQIHHAGLVTQENIAQYAVGPSADEKNPRSKALTIDDIHEIRGAFITGAVRAKKAGYNGVELHGAHGYLLNQFASSSFNRREDEYGGTLEKSLKLAVEIIRGIRSACGKDFIIGYRLGANSPTLDDGIRIAGFIEQAGIDLLHVSHGGSLLNLPRPPKDFEYNWIVFSGITIKKHVKIPVIVVNEIKTSERASWLTDNGHADFVALARPQLADPAWTNHMKNNEPVNACLTCKPKCRWYENSELCPAVQRLKKSGLPNEQPAG